MNKTNWTLTFIVDQFFKIDISIGRWTELNLFMTVHLTFIVYLSMESRNTFIVIQPLFSFGHFQWGVLGFLLKMRFNKKISIRSNTNWTYQIISNLNFTKCIQNENFCWFFVLQVVYFHYCACGRISYEWRNFIGKQVSKLLSIRCLEFRPLTLFGFDFFF